MKPITHLQKNRETYKEIKNNLNQTRKKFETTNQETRRKMLRTSHRFAVLSIQTPVNLHEDAFRELEGLQPYNEPALQRVNYWKNKKQWINNLDGKTKILDAISAELLAGNTEKAHKILIDKVKGVGAVKASFTLAMLGYTDKMCLDTNLQQIADIEDPYNGVVVDKYEKQCRQVLQKFPELSKKLEPFMVQWVLFDMQREEISRHRCFFTAIQRK